MGTFGPLIGALITLKAMKACLGTLATITSRPTTTRAKTQMVKTYSRCAGKKTSMVLALIQKDGQPPLIALEVAQLPLCLRTLISRKASSFSRWRIYMLNQVMTTNQISRGSRRSLKNPTKSMVIQIGRFFLPLKKAAWMRLLRCQFELV